MSDAPPPDAAASDAAAPKAAASEDAARLAHLVEVWHATAQDVIGLLRGLPDGEWSTPTDLPGWDVRAVAAHLAHLESELAGHPQQQVEVPEAPHVKGPMGQFTEAGPVARAGLAPQAIVDELETCVAERYAALLADPPTDPAALGPGFAGLIGWTWQTLLSNRPLDLWMHEQDIRRAVGRPGGLDSPGAAHVADVFTQSVPFVLGKRAGAAPGTTLVLHVTGDQARDVAAGVGDDGRARLLPEPPHHPDATVTVDFESWIVLAGGRRNRAQVEATLEGDLELAERFVDGLAVTP